MDWATILPSIITSLLLTVIGYLFVPTILVLTGKKYNAKKLKRINIINCIVVWLLFRFLQAALGNDPSGGSAVILWGVVGHSILKKYCLDNETTTASPSAQSVSKESSIHIELSDNDYIPREYEGYKVYSSDILLQKDETPIQRKAAKADPQPIKTSRNTTFTTKYCSRCGNSVDPITKQCNGCGKQYFRGFSGKNIFVIILSVFLVVSLVVNTVLYFSNVSLRETNTSLNKSNYSLVSDVMQLEKKVSSLQKENDFYYEYWYNNNNKVSLINSSIVFIEDDGTNLYHKYECEKFVGNYWWAHNIEYAEHLGYKSCPLCCN